MSYFGQPEYTEYKRPNIGPDFRPYRPDINSRLEQRPLEPRKPEQRPEQEALGTEHRQQFRHDFGYDSPHPGPSADDVRRRHDFQFGRTEYKKPEDKRPDWERERTEYKKPDWEREYKKPDWEREHKKPDWEREYKKPDWEREQKQPDWEREREFKKSDWERTQKKPDWEREEWKRPEFGRETAAGKSLFEREKSKRAVELPYYAGWWRPRSDVLTLEDGDIRVEFELPGVARENIALTIENDTVTLQPLKPVSKREDTGYFYQQERHSGNFYRKLQLPTYVDSLKAELKYEDGILKFTTPKSDEATPRRTLYLREKREKGEQGEEHPGIGGHTEGYHEQH